MSRVTSSSSSGAVQIYDSNGNPITTTGTALNVNVVNAVFTTEDVIVSYNEVAAIAVGVETTINTYTAPVGKVAYLLTILGSGENRGYFNVYNNGVLLDRQYMNVTQLTAPFDYKTGSAAVPGMVIPVGNTVEIKAVNAGTSTAMYNGRFLILEVT